MYKTYLVKNHKEFEWIQLYLFTMGLKWMGTGKTVSRSLHYPLLVVIENGVMIYCYCYNEELYNSMPINHVSTMMRKDKIINITNLWEDI